MHHISIFITKDDGSFDKTPHLKLPQDFVLFTKGRKPKGLKDNRIVCYCSTDYFGGTGKQSAILLDNKVKIYSGWSTFGPINQALKRMGVVCEAGQDEFDTLRLGKYMTNEDIENAFII